MHFSSQVKKIRETLRTCLSAPKVEMISELQKCVLYAKSLLKTSKFDYYITQFETVEFEEFATTRYAVDLVKSFLEQDPTTIDNSRQQLSYELSLACENILTYTVDDCCMMQSEFHWYYCVDEGFAYKESEMGVVETPVGKKVIGKSRVAKVSELPTEFRTNLI